jgi:hypothetical protein
VEIEEIVEAWAGLDDFIGDQKIFWQSSHQYLVARILKAIKNPKRLRLGRRCS